MKKLVFFQVENEPIYLAAFDINICGVGTLALDLQLCQIASLFVGYWL